MKGAKQRFSCEPWKVLEGRPHLARELDFKLPASYSLDRATLGRYTFTRFLALSTTCKEDASSCPLKKCCLYELLKRKGHSSWALECIEIANRIRRCLNAAPVVSMTVWKVSVDISTTFDIF